jgi:hypothetical protein
MRPLKPFDQTPDTAFRPMSGVPHLAYGRRMTQADPFRPPRDADLMVFCATCGHSDAVHANAGNQRCLRSSCDCNGFIPGAGPDPSAQVLP